MEKESGAEKRAVPLRGLLGAFPDRLISAVRKVGRSRQVEVSLVGGTVRDYLLNRACHDLDLTVAAEPEKFCRQLIRELGGGTYVRLGTDREEAGRVVWQGLDIDISGYRHGAESLAQDLALRDFTINSMAVDLVTLATEKRPALIDPLDGFNDLKGGTLRHCPRAFLDDPLRLLRGYRFVATLEFRFTPETREEIAKHANLITEVAAERIGAELDAILISRQGADVFEQMGAAGLLQHLLPELYAGRGVEQPEFHHLDVLNHSFLTLRQLEYVIAAPAHYYPRETDFLLNYLVDTRQHLCLKWSALLHDIGKPPTFMDKRGEGGKVIFHNHDEVGRQLFNDMAARGKWSMANREVTGSLIAMHMHPFHLCNVQRTEPISRRAALKLCRRAGDLLPALFLLAMADSLASKGVQKPVEMEGELARLYESVMAIRNDYIQPVLTRPPLIGGKDLIEHFGLTPGPLFSVILEELQVMQVQQQVLSRKQALAWIEAFLKARETGEDKVTE